MYEYSDCVDKFYFLNPAEAETEHGEKRMFAFFKGKMAASNEIAVPNALVCDYCNTTCSWVVQIIVPGEPRHVCWSKACTQKAINEFNIALLDALPMRLVRHVNPKKERAKITNSVRWRVIKRDNFRCVACGSSDNLVVDHKHPICKGGTSDMSNLQTLCFVCNSGKGGS